MAEPSFTQIRRGMKSIETRSREYFKQKEVGNFVVLLTKYFIDKFFVVILEKIFSY